MSEYRQQLERRRTFSSWLSQGATCRVDEEVALVGKGCRTDAIFSYLTGNRVSEACELAQKEGERNEWTVACVFKSTTRVRQTWESLVKNHLSVGDHRLSLMLSQAAGSQDCRDLLALQLADWNRMQTDCYLPEERLRIFALLAGKPV